MTAGEFVAGAAIGTSVGMFIIMLVVQAVQWWERKP